MSEKSTSKTMAWKEIDDLHLLVRLFRAGNQLTINNFNSLVGLLNNCQETLLATTQGPAASASVVAPAIVGTVFPGAVSANYEINAEITAVNDAVRVNTYQLLRDGAAVGPAMVMQSDATAFRSNATISFIDNSGDFLSHVYSYRVTPAAGNVTVTGGGAGVSQGYISVKQVACGVPIPTPVPPGGLTPLNLGTAAHYASLTKAGISGGAGSTITGDLGVSPAAAASLTGFALVLDGSGTFATSAVVTGKVFAADFTAPTPANLTQEVLDMQAAFTAGNAVPPNFTDLYAGNLGGRTLTPGCYKWTSNVTVPTNVILSGSATDVFIFQIAGTFDLAAATTIQLVGGVLPKNIFWIISGASTIHATAVFNGNLLAQTSVATQAGSTINGRLLAQTAVTLLTTTIVRPAP